MLVCATVIVQFKTMGEITVRNAKLAGSIPDKRLKRQTMKVKDTVDLVFFKH